MRKDLLGSRAFLPVASMSLSFAGGSEVRLWVVAISWQPSTQMLPGFLVGAVKFGWRGEIIMKRAAEDKMESSQLGHGKNSNRETHI